MSTAIQRRRGTTAQHSTFTGLLGETTIDTDKKTVVVHDGATAGGFPVSDAQALRSATTIVDVAAAAAPSAGQVLKATSATAATWQTLSAGGDFSTNTASSVDSEVLLFSATAGKTGKRSKVVLTPVATGATITITDAKTLTVSDTITLGTNAITFGGSEVLTLAATKNVTFVDAFSTVGAHAVIQTYTGDTNVTFPTTGTLATLSGAESLAGKVMVGEATQGVDKGTVGTGTVTFTVSAANLQRLQVSGALTIAFAGWAASGIDSWIKLQMVNWGAATVTTPTINWQLPAGGFTTTFATYLTAIGRAALQTSGTDWGIFWTVDNGTTVYGKLL